MATTIDEIIPLRNIYSYSQIIDPIVNSKNMYYEIKTTVPLKEDGTPYKFDVFVVMGELLRQDKTPRNGYGCRIRNSITVDDNFDIYTCEFNNDYGSTGISSDTIPYSGNYFSGLGYARFTIGVGYNYTNKTLFYHIDPDKYGKQYGLQISNVEFPTNTRLYMFLVDVSKESTEGLTTNVTSYIMTKWDQFEYPDVAEDYIDRSYVLFNAIPSGDILQLNGAEAITDEVLDSTLFTIIEHSYDSNNSVIYVANDDQYLLEHCPVNIRTLTTLNKPKAKATITFTLQDQDTGYMDTIIENYTEGFFAYNMTIDLVQIGLETITPSRIINGSTKVFLDSFTINKLSSSKFELIMTCTKSTVDNNTYNKDTRYLFSSYSTVSFSYTGFDNDVYLALMRAKVDTKLEFTIIGDYYA